MADSDQVQSEQLIEHLTEQISHWRLTVPAILVLQVTRPLSFIASQGLLLCQPLLSFVYDAPRVADYAELLADRASMEPPSKASGPNELASPSSDLMSCTWAAALAEPCSTARCR